MFFVLYGGLWHVTLLFAIQSSLLVLLISSSSSSLLVEEEAPLVSLQSLEIRHSVGNKDQDQPGLSLPLRLDHLNMERQASSY